MNRGVRIKQSLNRWFPNVSVKTHHRILWNLTAYPGGDEEYLEEQIKYAALRTLPEIKGFKDRLEGAMGDVLDQMDWSLEVLKWRMMKPGV